MDVSTKRIIVIAVTVFLVLAATVVLNEYPADKNDLPSLIALAVENDIIEGQPDNPDSAELSENINLKLAFSEPGHFFTSDISVELIPSIEGAEIYYTTDGSDPVLYQMTEAEQTAANKQAAGPNNDPYADLPAGELLKVRSFTFTTWHYESPIEIKAPRGSDINVVTIRAVAVYNGTVSRPFVHTYFVGRDVHDRFDTLVFSLNIEETHLYDYNTGIFVEGRTRYEYRRDNPRAHINPPSPANFNWRGMEGERPVHIEVFEPSGERVVAQQAGMRAHGGWSRAADQKSIRLIARSEYEPGFGKFHYDFFPGDNILDGFNTPLLKYDQIVLRNGANDRDFGMLRNETGYEFAKQMNLHVTSPTTPAAIFLNGEYYGFAWLQVRVNEQYLEDKFNAPTRNFQIVGMGEQWIDTDDEEAREAIEYLNSFHSKNFRNDAVFKEYESLVDIDNLLTYYALQTYLGNHDWPNNNLKRWRYTGPQVEGLIEELDGRWRYLVFDLDWILGLYEDPPNAFRPTIQEMMNTRNDRYSYVLNSLFVRPEIVDKFAILMCDIAANVVTPENVKAVIERLYGMSKNEIVHAFAHEKYAHWVSTGSVEHNHNNMIKVATERSEYIFKSLREHFEWEDSMFTVEVTGSPAFIGTQIGESSTYFDHLIIPLRPAPGEYTVFENWVLNGEVIYTPEITVSLADATDGVVSVELVTREELPKLIFSKAFGSSAQNGCALYNPGDTAVSTAGMYLTNDMTNPFRWALPAATLEPGATLEFAGRGSRNPDDLHKIQMGFNVRHGHRLFLCDEEGNVIANMLVEAGS